MLHADRMKDYTGLPQLVEPLISSPLMFPTGHEELSW